MKRRDDEDETYVPTFLFHVLQKLIFGESLTRNVTIQNHTRVVPETVRDQWQPSERNTHPV